MGLQGVFGLGTWEEGVWGRTVLLEAAPAGFCLLPEDKAEHGAGPGVGSWGWGPSAWPEMGTGEGSQSCLAPWSTHPNLASPYRARVEGCTPHYREKPPVHRTASVQTRNRGAPSSGRHRPCQGERQGAELGHSPTHPPTARSQEDMTEVPPGGKQG